MAKLISKTYGDALFAAAVEAGSLDEFYKAAKMVSDVLRANKDFGKLLSHPQISKEEKSGIIEEAFKRAVPGEIVGLMSLMLTKGRADEMLSVFDYFIGLVKEEKKIGQASVTTAAALSNDQKQRIEKRLLETTVYETFEMQYHIDESLIGGMVIRIGDRVIDSSIKTKLYDLSRELRKIQV